MPKYIYYQISIFGFFCLYIFIYNQPEIATSNLLLFDDLIAQDWENDTITERIVFYNVENLFHPSDDPVKADDDFTPSGQYHWTYDRYYSKINKLGKLFVAIGQGHMPALIGLCEVENSQVLSDIINKSIIKKHKYKIIHKESPDIRGIDVALLYDPSKFKPIKYEFINVEDATYPEFKTRDILHVEGSFNNTAYCHIFINHWPSRRGGKMISDEKREIMARLLCQFVDHCYEQDELTNIIIMGDFNDEPGDQSIQTILGAKDPNKMIDDTRLINLMYPYFIKGKGTHYRINNFTEASVLDQIIVSRSLYFGKNQIKIKYGSTEIFKNEFLLDKKNGRPLRTFQGLKYLGGFSDHLPIYTDVQMLY